MNGTSINNIPIIKSDLDEPFVKYSTQLGDREQHIYPSKPSPTTGREKESLMNLLRSFRDSTSSISNQLVNELMVYLCISLVDVVDDDTSFDLLA